MGFVAGVDYGVSPTSELLNPMPEDVKVIIIPSNSFVLTFSEENVNAATAQANLQTFLDNGGSLIVHMAADSLAGLSYTAPGIGQTIDVPDTNQLELTAPTTNGIVLGPDSMPGTADDLTNSGIQWPAGAFAVHSVLPALPNGATTVISSNGQAVMAEYVHGDGLVVVTTISMEFGNAGDPGVSNGFGNPLRTVLNEFNYAISVAMVSPTPSADAIIESTRSDIDGFGLNAGIASSFISKLNAALAALGNGNATAALRILDAFINAVDAQRGKALSDAQADALISKADAAQTIIQNS